MRKLAVLTAAAGALTLAASAQAATWKVALGEQARPPAGTPKMATLDLMMPGKLEINVGDKVTFSSASFHTAAYIPGNKPPAFLVADPTKGKYTGIEDAAGAPFYFDGLARLAYNVQVFAPFGGTVVNGKALNSGPLSPKTPKSPPATATFTFPKAGTFTFICTIHPNMKTQIVVKPAGAAVAETPSQVQGEILAEQAAAWKKLKAEAAAVKPPAKTVYAGFGTDRTVIGFFPKVLKVKVGTTVDFVSRSGSEPHNIAFGPKKYIEAFQKKYDLFPQGPKGTNQVSPPFVYGTDKQYAYDGSNHGNGFLATKLTMEGIPGLPRSEKVTFTKAGTYKYFCMLHGPEMNGTIVVTP